MKILEKLNPAVASITPYPPGRPIEELARELGIDPETIIKLASNESALGPSPMAVDAIKDAAEEAHIYPDGSAYELKKALGEHYDLPMDHFMVANGSNEVLELVGHCFLSDRQSAVFSDYSFIVYRLVCALFNAPMISVPATPGLGHDLNAMSAAVKDDSSVIFICNPNNPTGTSLAPKEICSFIEEQPDDKLIVLDEAYAEISTADLPDWRKYILENYPVIVTRTFSKAYGLAGLRLGYAIGSPQLIRALNQARQPFNCNLIAQKAGIAALTDHAFISAAQKHNHKSKAAYEAFCEANSLAYIPSACNFIMIKPGNSATVFQQLQQLGVIVRPMEGYQLGDYIRVTYGTDEQNERFFNSLKQVLE